MIYIGADHRGYELKEKAKQWLAESGYQFEDCGAFEYNKDDDYPDFAKTVAERLQRGSTSLERVYQGGALINRGILICGSGIGVAVAANKIKGIRAGTAFSTEQVKASVNDEDLNILTLPADYINEDIAKEIIKTFLETKFSREDRHVRRLNKIASFET